MLVPPTLTRTAYTYWRHNQGRLMPLVRQTIINPKRKTILQYRGADTYIDFHSDYELYDNYIYLRKENVLQPYAFREYKNYRA